MKRIAIFCDGTWNRSDAPEPTNVVELARAVLPTDADGQAQAVFYYPGVGTGRGTGAVARLTDRVLGGGLGWGLLDNVVTAYRNLIFAYEPGDDIQIFGFSRGAYTARSLAGLIRTCGVLSKDNLHLLPHAVRRYQRRNGRSHPDHISTLRFRAKVAPMTATSEDDLLWRRYEGRGAAGAVELKIGYLGIWDTVGALGIPGRLPGSGWINARHAFHDVTLSRSVARARHAVAIDEHRGTFAPTLWDNLDQLNAARTPDDLPYEQVWFAGDHGSVGGGGDIRGLSAITLGWIADGAGRAGLALDADRLAKLVAPADALAPLRNRTAPRGLLDRALGLLPFDRKGPEWLSEVAPSVRDRWGRDAGYRPKTLGQLAGALGPR